MGRWAQRQRGGGGPGPPGTLITISSATQTDDTRAVVYYTADITPADFDPADFETQPSAQTGVTFGTEGANYLQVYFTLPIDADVTITYSGTAPGVLTPQTVPLDH